MIMRFVRRTLLAIGIILLAGMLALLVFLMWHRYTIEGVPVIYPREVSVSPDCIDLDLTYESTSAVFLKAVPSLTDGEMRISILFRFYVPLLDDNTGPEPTQVRIACDTRDIERIYFTWHTDEEMLIWERPADE